MSWTNVTVGDAFDFVRNGKNVKQSKELDGLPITRIETIADRTINPARVGYAGLSEAGNEQWLLRRGDILFSHINSVDHIGKCAVYEGAPEKLIHGMNLLALRPGKLLHPKFAYYAISNDTFRARLLPFVNKAVNQASVSTTNLKTLEIPLPPLEEQKRIAAILDKADQLRQKRRQAIALLDSLTQSIFLEMFGDPVSNPKGWPSVALEEVADFMSGGTPSKSSPSFWVGQIPWVSPKDMKSVAVHDSIDHISEQAVSRSAAKLAPIDAVLIVVRGMILAHTVPIAILGQPAAFNQDIKALLFHDSIIPRFGLWNLLVQASAILKTVSTAAHGTKRLEMETIAGLPVLCPSESLQRRFAESCTRLEASREQLHRAYARADALFSSLQGRLFSAEVTTR